MVSSTIYPPGALTFHLTPARLQLLINSVTLVAALSHFPLASPAHSLIWAAVAALWALRAKAFSTLASNQVEAEGGGADEHVGGDLLGGEAGGVSEKAERMGLPLAEEATSSETLVSVAGFVVGVVVFVVGARNLYFAWHD